jgi:DNA-binding XRE family transcriptional regulator
MTTPRLRWKKFGRDLRYIRNSESHASLREMARLIGINHSTYVRAEKGKTVEAAHFMRICSRSDLDPWKYTP